MTDDWIKQTIKDDRVLCVVYGVITSSDKVEIKRINMTKFDMKLIKKVSLFFITTNNNI